MRDGRWTLEEGGLGVFEGCWFFVGGVDLCGVFFCGGCGELVAAVVVFIVAVAFDPVKRDCMLFVEFQESGPEVLVFGIGSVAFLPVVGLPFLSPAFAYGID